MRLMTMKILYLLASALFHQIITEDYETRSGIKPWVDPDTPDEKKYFTNARGKKWELVMSDEFNIPGRSFRPGRDHIWTSIEKPDGVNAALQLYSHNMTSTECGSDGTCYLYLETAEDVARLTTWNNYQANPGYQSKMFYYRSAMLQSWNKFCYQGGMLEMRAILPGGVTKETGNPDLSKGDSGRVEALDYYLVWPGVWMMGNLARAIFSASTNRMWPFSYNDCNDKVFNSSFQRISACDDDPGYGMNPNQGRGAPEIDLVEGAGTEISSSIQIAPGMPLDFRRFQDGNGCVYEQQCAAGANNIDVPTAMYASRGHVSWYQNLRYGSNNLCAPDAKAKQSLSQIKSSLASGIDAPKCNVAVCPASFDVHSDLSEMNGGAKGNWGINSNGTCFAFQNPYSGAYLCNPGNPSDKCPKKGYTEDPKVTRFEYQMDAISANWHANVGLYTKYHIYQVEWVTGRQGYVRWTVAGNPIFEVPAKSIIDVPQDSGNTNPKKLMIEEPMYIIMNVAVSSDWNTGPPNPGRPCRADGNSSAVNKICDAFPLKFKVDYIRLYQDLSPSSNMSVSCDPASHPTKKWIEGHLNEYEDPENKMVEVNGMAFCKDDDDCSVLREKSVVRTGICVKNRCKCSSNAWKGPRCSSTNRASVGFRDMLDTKDSFGPPAFVEFSLAVLIGLATFASVYYSMVTSKRMEEEMLKRKDAKALAEQNRLQKQDNVSVPGASVPGGPKDNYHVNFV